MTDLNKARVESEARQADSASTDGAATGRPPSPFASFAGYQRLQQRRSEARRLGVDATFFATHDGVNRNIITCEGRELINFSSYNYLGLSGHPQVSEAARAAIDRYGTSVSASRIVAGQIPLHEELECSIADFIGSEEALVFVSGYGANVAAISHLFGHRDLVIHDALAHNSIVTGCQLSGARRMRFAHNDWDALDTLLTRHRNTYQRALIVVESLYSMDGDITDLTRAIEVKKRHDALLMVDEAHSLGVLGERGRGIGELFDIDRRDVDIWMGTLSKSLASCGGYIAGDHELIDYLRYLAPGFIFSVGLSPADSAAALTSLRVLQREPERVERLRQRSTLFLQQAHAHDLNIGTACGAPVIPLIIGNSLTAVRLSTRLRQLGIQVQPIIYPAVDEAVARLRFFITALHTEEQIVTTVETVAHELAALERSD